MSYLIAIAVGPVQEFIAAARRTRDLWFGSYLLSEISRAVAIAVEIKDDANDKTNLIFPASVDAENVANVIMAVLTTNDSNEVAAIAKQAKLKAQERWLEFVNDAWDKAHHVIRQEIWDEQKNDVIEYYAAWVQESGNYVDDRKKLMRLLAGRKNLRDFLPAIGSDATIPKSSLDGQRASVLKKRKKFPTQFRIREGEQLDVVGLVKRIAGLVKKEGDLANSTDKGSSSFPSVSRIAADPWVRGNRDEAQFSELLSVCDQLPAQVLHRLSAGTFPQFQDFPYEGTAVYVSRHHEWKQEISEEDHVSLDFLQDTLRKFKEEPSPYLAILVADGDKMGAAISKLLDSKTNLEFSKDLAAFADKARTIVNDHNGVLIYAGGDDVLAFLPVDKCLSCARALRKKFIECLEPQVPNDTPTLSVGIAIGHFMENLEDLLNYGRDAEKAAKKPDRDGLAIHLHKRGGAPIVVRDPWSKNPDQRIQKFAELMIAGTIPTKLPYELRSMASLYESWPVGADEAIKKDLYRLIAKKTSRGKQTVRQALDEHIDIKDMNSTKLMTLAHEMLIARMIATAIKQAAGQTVAVEEVRS